MSEYKRLTKWETSKGVKCVKYWQYSQEQIAERLALLEDKIENGMLIELPCKVGDTVYCIYHFFDVEEDFEYDIIPEEVVDIIVQEDDFDIGTACRMIGKFKRVCVCLTKAEAEARLKELQEKQK